MIGHYGVENLVVGALVGFMMWLGFVAPLMAGSVVFEKRSMTYLYVNGGFNLVSIIVMGAIISVLM